METRAVDAMTGVDGAEAARRRRERRLRSWWRHERMSIACALAEALHHSSGTSPSTCDTRVVEGAQNDALRGQNTDDESQRGAGARVAQRAAAPEASSTRDAAGSGSGAVTDPVAHGDWLRAGSQPRGAADG